VNIVIWTLLLLNTFTTLYLLFLHYRQFRRSRSSSQSADLSDSNFSGFKIKLMRYNPFPGVGGEQSFLLCLLDRDNSGVIITSLHTPSQTRIYAKPVREGKADGPSLSKEESAFLKTVINN